MQQLQQQTTNLFKWSEDLKLLIIRVVAALSNRRRQPRAEPGASGGINTQGEQRVCFFKLLRLKTGFSLHSRPSWGSLEVLKCTVTLVVDCWMDGFNPAPLLQSSARHWLRVRPALGFHFWLFRHLWVTSLWFCTVKALNRETFYFHCILSYLYKPCCQLGGPPSCFRLKHLNIIDWVILWIFIVFQVSAGTKREVVRSLAELLSLRLVSFCLSEVWNQTCWCFSLTLYSQVCPLLCSAPSWLEALFGWVYARTCWWALTWISSYFFHAFSGAVMQPEGAFTQRRKWNYDESILMDLHLCSYLKNMSMKCPLPHSVNKQRKCQDKFCRCVFLQSPDMFKLYISSR